MRKFLIFLFLISLANAQATIHMGIISDSAYYGEREAAWRIKRAAESLGWKVFLDESRGCHIRAMRNLDWVISLIPNGYRKPDCLNYMVLFHPFDFFDKEKKMLPIFEKYDGYLLTIPLQYFDHAFSSENKQFFFTRFYPTLQEIEYKRVELNDLVTTVPAWGNRQHRDKYKNLYGLLSRSGFVKFYGPRGDPKIFSNGYMGRVPFDGISLIRIFQKHGIVLVIHSWHHNHIKIPSARIFEAAASSAVIICDQNSFVKEHFGDSLYYIDTSLSPEEIYMQISDHMDAIRRDPEAALAKAAKAHQIFTKKFLMTDQLLQLESMHNKIKASQPFRNH